MLDYYELTAYNDQLYINSITAYWHVNSKAVLHTLPYQHFVRYTAISSISQHPLPKFIL